MSLSGERERLESIASDSRYAEGANRFSIEYSFKVLSRHFRPGSILEMGPAEGVMTDLLVTLEQPLHALEGSERFCRDLRERHPHIAVSQGLFETFETDERFDNIVLGHVLEHVDDPVAILRRAAGWLTPRGRILAAVPNSRSLHRQAAVIMGLLPYESSLNEADHHHGHRRVYDPERFRAEFRDAGLKVAQFGGYWLKPVSNSQIERDWTPEMLNAFMHLGERYPDIAGNIYVVAERA